MRIVESSTRRLKGVKNCSLGYIELRKNWHLTSATLKYVRLIHFVEEWSASAEPLQLPDISG